MSAIAYCRDCGLLQRESDGFCLGCGARGVDYHERSERLHFARWLVECGRLSDWPHLPDERVNAPAYRQRRFLWTVGAFGERSVLPRW